MASSASSSPEPEPLFQRGKSLLNDALSPSSRRQLDGMVDADENGSSSPASRKSPAASPHSQDRSRRLSSGRKIFDLLDSLKPSTSSLNGRKLSDSSQQSQDHQWRLSSFLHHSSRSSDFEPEESHIELVQVRCATRAYGMKLGVENGLVVVHAFASGLSGLVELSQVVVPGDALVGVNRTMAGLDSVEDAESLLAAAELPVVLTFQRSTVSKATLGEYTLEDIERHLLHRRSVLLKSRSPRQTAMLVQALIEVIENKNSLVPLHDFLSRVESSYLSPVHSYSDAVSQQKRLDNVKEIMRMVQERVRYRRKEQVDKWNHVKSSQLRRIEIMEQQQTMIDSKLNQMRAHHDDLQPENHALWEEYIELRHLSGQLDDTIERAKQEHYLPEFEGYSLRFGSGGVYIGVGSIWIPSFHAKFTIETRSTAPNFVLHLSTPSSHGLKLRVTNFKLATEGRLPSFHCDELNVEAQLIADIPLEYDDVSGWQVPGESLNVKLKSLVYYERQVNSTKRGTDHDTIMRMFINRMLPTVVRHAVQSLLCVELGPLIERRDVQVVLTGDVRISGKPLAVYDSPLNTEIVSPSSRTRISGSRDNELSEMAREMLGLSSEEASVLNSVFQSLIDPAPPKISLFSKVVTPRFCIRNLITHFEQFNAFPHLKALACELWGLSLQLSSQLLSMTPRSPLGDASPFSLLVDTLEQIQDYPVDVSVSLIDVTCRLDLCEAGATAYTTVQRIIRQKMESTSVGVGNFEDLRTGSYLQNKLSKLDALYEKWNRFLSHIMSNVDEMGVVIRGGFPGGVLTKMYLEMRDLSCKGPCGGAVTIPLTDLSSLTSPDGLQLRSSDRSQASTMTRTFENGALVFSKFSLQDLIARSSNQGNPGTDEGDEDASRILPHNRLKVSVTNTSARILFEVPLDIALLTPGATLVPFEISLVTDDGSGSPPQVRVESGEFSKFQYRAEKISVTGPLKQLAAPSNESTEEHERMSTPSNGVNDSSAGTDDSVWDEYLESPFFSVKLHLFTSCQVTSEHLYWSFRSASLTEPKVFQFKHRLSLTQLLQDIGMLSVVDRNEISDAQRKRLENARMRRALHSTAEASSPSARGRSSFSNFSDSKTLFSRTSFADTVDDDTDRNSEPTPSSFDRDVGSGSILSTFDDDDEDDDESSSDSDLEDEAKAPPPPPPSSLAGQQRPSADQSPRQHQQQMPSPIRVAVPTPRSTPPASNGAPSQLQRPSRGSSAQFF